MQSIWKTPIEITDHQEVELPEGAQPLSCQVQNGQLCVWWLLNPDRPTQGHAVRVAGTGNPLGDDVRATRFVGTAQLDGLVWHVFA